MPTSHICTNSTLHHLLLVFVLLSIEINSSKRLKYAVAERAEGDKILQVKSAEAEAEAKYLSGKSIEKMHMCFKATLLCLLY